MKSGFWLCPECLYSNKYPCLICVHCEYDLNKLKKDKEDKEEINEDTK